MATVTSPSRPDLDAHAHATRSAFPDVVADLSRLLGHKLVAYIASVKETRTVHEWADGSRKRSSDQTEARLRVALRVARMVGDQDGPEVAQAWFQGLNPHLDERSPARLLREGEIDEVGRDVIAAARSFLND
jgi:hypothetical protein